ncbi:ABC transporter family substrate-binding protein [Kitasatospora sp. NPDC093679]|uniref:ABC transporter family substrate-binding protein n=1 Tax=Kitasatospora sp. NPDC093679 TaxID=3154983 RepID=UPI003437153F
MRASRAADRAAAAAAALCLAAGLAGCTGGSQDGPAASDVTAADRAHTRDGGTVRWAVDAVPATLNVYQPAADADSELIARALLPGLFRLDDRGRATPDPDYLAGAESTPAGRSPQTVTYRLNPAAVWSDGSPLSAADFTAQWKALSGADPAFRSDRPAGYDAIASVEQGSGPHEVKVVFKQPYADWRSLFSPLYPAARTSTADAFNQPLDGGFRTSAGPFVLTGWDKGAGRAVLTRNPRWWGDPAKAQEIDFLAVPAAGRLDALAKDELDVAAVTASVDRAVPEGTTAAAPPDAAAMVEASAHALHRAETLPGLTLHRAPAAAFTQLTLNTARGPLADTTVRQAVARAVDRQKTATAALGPLGLGAVPLGNHLLVAGQDGYRDNSGALGTAAAGTLLDRAGWASSDGTRSKDGKKLALTLLIPDGSTTARRTADALTADLAAAGIAVAAEPVPVDTFVTDHLAKGDFDLALFSWPASAYPSDTRPLYAKPQPGPDGLPVVGRNYGRGGTAEIDRLLDRAAGELDPAARQGLLQQADARLWQLADVVPLYRRPDLVAVRNGVAGAGAYGFTTPRYQDVGFRQD